MKIRNLVLLTVVSLFTTVSMAQRGGKIDVSKIRTAEEAKKVTDKLKTDIESNLGKGSRFAKVASELINFGRTQSKETKEAINTYLNDAVKATEQVTRTTSKVDKEEIESAMEKTFTAAQLLFASGNKVAEQMAKTLLSLGGPRVLEMVSNSDVSYSASKIIEAAEYVINKAGGKSTVTESTINEMFSRFESIFDLEKGKDKIEALKDLEKCKA